MKSILKIREMKELYKFHRTAPSYSSGELLAITIISGKFYYGMMRILFRIAVIGLPKLSVICFGALQFTPSVETA